MLFYCTHALPHPLCTLQADKPKQQRRKPAIAEIKRDEDGDAPTAAAADSADLVEQAAPEVKSDDDADEPVSGSDQEPEPEADTVQKKKRAYNRSAAPHALVLQSYCPCKAQTQL